MSVKKRVVAVIQRDDMLTAMSALVHRMSGWDTCLTSRAPADLLEQIRAQQDEVECLLITSTLFEEGGDFIELIREIHEIAQSRGWRLRCIVLSGATGQAKDQAEERVSALPEVDCLYIEKLGDGGGPKDLRSQIEQFFAP